MMINKNIKTRKTYSGTTLRTVNFSYSIKTALKRTGLEKLATCFQEKLRILFHLLFGHWIAMISIHSTTRYKIWTALQERVYQKSKPRILRIVAIVGLLKQRLVVEFDHFDQGIVDRAINEWRDHLSSEWRAFLISVLKNTIHSNKF